MMQDEINISEIVAIREQFRAIGEYKIADILKEWLTKQNVLIEDGKRTLYLSTPIPEFLALEEKKRQSAKRFASWLNGQYKKLGVPLTSYTEFMD
jgi:hypothetical protein